MFNWLHTNTPNPILLELGPVTIHWYGFMIALGASLGIFISYNLAKRYQLDLSKFLDIIFYTLVFGLVGDRLYYVIYNWQYYKDHLVEIPMFWQGGLAIYGAYIGGVLAVLYFSKKFKFDFWRVTDILVVAVSIALAFGRWGNYFNQELFGKPTDFPWGIPIQESLRPVGYENFQYFHPTFIYESLLMLLIFVLLVIGHKIILKRNHYSGLLTGGFFVLYGSVRIFTEQLRLDYSPYFFGQRVNFWGAIILLTFGLAMFVWRIIYLAKIRINAE